MMGTALIAPGAQAIPSSYA